jgi:hypothetical protein
MSTDPTYAEEDFESITVRKHKYNDHYIVVEISQQTGTDGHKHAAVAVHTPSSGLLGQLGDLFRTQELNSWSWGIDDDLEAEVAERIEEAKEFIDQRQATITATEDEVRNAFKHTAPESERKRDYRNPNEYREWLATTLRESLLSRILIVGMTSIVLAILVTAVRSL